MKSLRSRLLVACALVLTFGAAEATYGMGVKARILYPPYDDCASAEAVGEVTNMTFDTTSATFDGPGHCTQSPNLWYCYTASCTGDVTVSLAGGSYDTMLVVYKGCECYPGASDRFSASDLTVREDYLGDGYGVVGELERRAIRTVARTEGILLDPVYTGRAMGGLIDMIERGELSREHSVLFWHTGGTPALFPYARRL